ncbi:TonB-dependent receptor [Novosphingobium sp.]|uniref:TonB-dependent receptor n=1 Tax=Novosphingobium sp. TaxID=1874826 RepID=UPI0035ADD026
MTIRKQSIALSISIGALALGLAAPAQAQDAKADDNAEVSLDEIIVTAQKRAQNLQEVPIAISALGAEKIAQLGVRDTRDISGLAPNVTIVRSVTGGSGAAISIRGISGGGSESFGLDQANAVYVDGIYIGRSGATALDVMDLERVEVLRGPQGTLFGRNTTGGAISFISRDPSQDLRIAASGTGGNRGQWAGRISLDTGSILGIRTSFSYAHSQQNGTVDNILQPDNAKDPGARKLDSFRAALKADLGGTGSIRYIFDYSRNEIRSPAFQLTNLADGTARPPLVVDGQAGVTQTQVAPVQQYIAAATFANPACKALAVPDRQYRSQICLDDDGPVIDKIWGHNLQIQNDFGGFQVKLTAGYRNWSARNTGSDLDGMGAFQGPMFTSASLFNGMPASLLAFVPSIPAVARATIAAAPVPTTTQSLFDTSNTRHHKQFSQELEVSGKTDSLDWVVGGFYFWEKGSELNYQNSGFVLDTNATFLANFGALGPSFAAANPARYRLVPTLGLLEYTTSAESSALYGQATWYVGGRDAGGLSLTGGLRYTWDNKHMIRQQSGATRPSTPATGDASFKRLTWNAMARYEFSSEVNAYLRAASGYRSGGFNAPDTTQVGTSTLLPFDSEKIMSYEAGIKTELLDRHLRLNLAGYHNNYKDLAVAVPVPTASAGVFGSRIVNAGKVNYTGVEVEGQAVLTDNFTIDGNFGYVDVQYKEFNIPTSGAVGSPIVNIASISKPGYTSKYTGNIALNAVFPLPGGMRLVGRAGYTYESPKYSFSNSISAPFNEQVRSDARKTVDAQIGLDRIALGGAQAEVKVWVRNLTNQHQFVRAVDFGSLGYAGGFFSEPRMYGATVSVKIGH